MKRGCAIISKFVNMQLIYLIMVIVAGWVTSVGERTLTPWKTPNLTKPIIALCDQTAKIELTVWNHVDLDSEIQWLKDSLKDFLGKVEGI